MNNAFLRILGCFCDQSIGQKEMKRAVRKILQEEIEGEYGLTRYSR